MSKYTDRLAAVAALKTDLNNNILHIALNGALLTGRRNVRGQLLYRLPPNDGASRGGALTTDLAWCIQEWLEMGTDDVQKCWWIVTRHGSNAANQSWTPKMEVHACQAYTAWHACHLADQEPGLTVYNNQTLSARRVPDWQGEQWGAEWRALEAAGLV